MYNIYDFVQGIDVDNLSISVARNFDKVMALYYIIGGRSDVDICIVEDGNSVGFSLLLEDEDKTVTLNDQLNGNHFTVYGETLDISSSIMKGDTLSVHLNHRRG